MIKITNGLEIPTVTTIVYGLFVLGSGYFGVWLKSKYSKKEFYNIPAFDKSIQSLMIGIPSFFITVYLLAQLPLEIITNQHKFLKFLEGAPYAFFIQIFLVYCFVLLWLQIEKELEEILFSKEKEKKKSFTKSKLWKKVFFRQ